jgi:hypothetical protein
MTILVTLGRHSDADAPREHVVAARGGTGTDYIFGQVFMRIY